MNTAERIFELLREMGAEQKDLATALNISTSRVSEWKTGKTKSYQKFLPEIADYLGTSVDYLVGKFPVAHMPKAPEMQPFEASNLLRECESLTRSQIDSLFESLEAIKKEPADLTADELPAVFMSLYSQLTPEQKDLVLATMREMSKGK